MKRVVIVGIGNIILGDEGVGVHVLSRLRLEKLPKDVSLVEGGVGGVALLNSIVGFECAIFIDALAGDEPGRIRRLTEVDLNQKVRTQLHPMSLHDIGLAETIKIGQTVYPSEMPKKIIIYGIEISELKKYSTKLSKSVGDSVDKVVKMILKEVKNKARR